LNLAASITHGAPLQDSPATATDREVTAADMLAATSIGHSA
jgi:hypothetical protein